MTSTLEDSNARIQRSKELRDARRAREAANRVGTNIKPHIKEIVEEEAAATHLPVRTFVRVLLLEALTARGHDLDEAFRQWKERNPDESTDGEA